LGNGVGGTAWANGWNRGWNGSWANTSAGSNRFGGAALNAFLAQRGLASGPWNSRAGLPWSTFSSRQAQAFAAQRWNMPHYNSLGFNRGLRGPAFRSFGASTLSRGSASFRSFSGGGFGGGSLHR
jgi:hypothetical protein